MNLFLALVLTAVVLYQGADVPAYEDQPPVVGAVAAGSPAAKSDIQPGDLILSVADHPVDTWEKFFIAIGSLPDRAVTIRLQRHAVELTPAGTPASIGPSPF